MRIHAHMSVLTYIKNIQLFHDCDASGSNLYMYYFTLVDFLKDKATQIDFERHLNAFCLR